MNTIAAISRLQPIEAAFAWRQTPKLTNYLPCEEARLELNQVSGAADLAVREALQRMPTTTSPPACYALMQDVAEELRNGIGAALLSLPVTESLSDMSHQALAATMFRCLGPIVDQKISGAQIYAVRDQGKPLGPGVRRSVTRADQQFHTDGGWLTHAPEIVALYCVRQSPEGGENQVASLARVHNQLLGEAPHLLDALYAPVPWDRQREHNADEVGYAMQSVFSTTARDGFSARYYTDYVRKGASLAATPLSEDVANALSRADAIIKADSQKIEFKLEPGQMLLLNNRRIAHARSGFEYEKDLQQRRLMLRLWTRLEGSALVEGN